MSKFLKKLPILLLCALCAMGLVACASNQSASSAPSSSSDSSSSPSTASSPLSPAGFETSVDPISVGDKVLVAYYSGTGNTAAVAQMVANATEGTLYAIEATPAYTAQDLEYDSADSRASKEHEDLQLRQQVSVNADVPDWSSYDTVFLGYPIWWGEAAYPMEAFVRANDFNGKNVIPFCTSGSSGIGSSVEGLAELTKTGNWGIGMRFPATVTQEEVDDWVNTFILAL